MKRGIHKTSTITEEKGPEKKGGEGKDMEDSRGHIIDK